MNDFPFSKVFVDSRVTDIKRTCDLVMFGFKTPNNEKIYLHTQCILRVFDEEGSLVICSLNMYDRSPNYRKKWFRRYDWTTVGSTVFDDAVKDYKEKLFNTKVSDIKDNSGDLLLYFENGMRMEVLISVSKYDDTDYCENYRIFDEDKTKEHFIV